jgi:hypothetical protein
MKRYLTMALGLLAGGLFLLPSLGADEKKAEERKTIELCICLDTSNSMDGLIGSAKAKLWDIVNELAKAKPMPNLKVALYSYGNNGYDPKTGWVRQELDFTTDLDKVNEKLFGLKTYGGTEYVGRVTRDAMHQLKWSEDAGTLKIIFVCGNEAATQDPEVKLEPLAETAARRGIVVNTIYCGLATHPEAQGWKHFADLAEGRFASINQERGAVAIVTPHDKELAKLSSEINLTYCFWGKDAKNLADNQRRQDANAAQAGLGVAAARAQSKGGGAYRFEDHDLVEKLKNDPKFDVKTIKEEELNDELKKMKPEEREKHIKELLAKREMLQKEINELSKKREAYIAEELKKQGSKADQAFDEAVKSLLREQAKKKGIEIPEK